MPMELTLTNVKTGAKKRVTVRPCEECGTEIMHDHGAFAECPVCCHVNTPV